MAEYSWGGIILIILVIVIIIVLITTVAVDRRASFYLYNINSASYVSVTSSTTSTTTYSITLLTTADANSLWFFNRVDTTGTPLYTILNTTTGQYLSFTGPPTDGAPVILETDEGIAGRWTLSGDTSVVINTAIPPGYSIAVVGSSLVLKLTSGITDGSNEFRIL